MDFLTKKPIYLVLILVIGFALWKLPEAFNQSQAYESAPSTQERNQYLNEKDKPLSKADSVEVNAFYDLLASLRIQLDLAKQGRCGLGGKAGEVRPRLIDKSLLDYLLDADLDQEDFFFDRVSTLNSQNPFPKVNLTVGDGFTADLAQRNWHQGLLGYIRNLMRDRVCFVVKVERVDRPKMYADGDFYAGTVQVGIFACDLQKGEVLCWQSIDVKSDDSQGLPKKGSAMNQQLYLELMEKAVRETKLWCEGWLRE